MNNDLVKVPIQSFPESEPIDPYGKKKGYMSWSQVGRRISEMTPKELLNQYGVTLSTLTELGVEEKLSNTTLREIAMLAAYVETIRHPNPSMLNLIMEREEGRVPQMQVTATGNIGDWMEYAKEQGIEIEAVMEEAKKIMAGYDEPPKVVEGEIVE